MSGMGEAIIVRARRGIGFERAGARQGRLPDTGAILVGCRDAERQVGLAGTRGAGRRADAAGVLRGGRRAATGDGSEGESGEGHGDQISHAVEVSIDDATPTVMPVDSFRSRAVI